MMPIIVKDVKYFTPEELGKKTGFSKWIIRAQLRKGTLKGIKIGRAWHLTEEMLAQYLDTKSKQKKTKLGAEQSKSEKENKS